MATGDKPVNLDSLKTAYDTSAKFTAPMEASSTASAAHATGEYFVYNGVLYIATSDIASGATITPNTNCLAVPGGVGGEVSDLKSAFEDLPYAIYNPGKNTDGKWLDSTGTIHEQSGWSITDYLMIGKKAEFYLKTRVSSDNVKSCFYDNDKGFLSAFKTGTAGDNTLIPVENAHFVRFSIQSSDASDFKYSSLLFLEKIESIAPEQIAASEIKSFRDEIVSGGYYGSNGGIVASANWSHTPLYEVNENDVVSVINAQALWAVLFDSSRTAIDSKITENTPSNLTFTVPANVKYIGFNIVNANLSGYSCLVNGITLGALYELPWLNVASQNESIWKNKTYISHGDSITWQDGHTWGSGSEQGQVARGYQTVFSESVGLKSYNNQGKSGWSMAVVNGNGVVNTIMSISDYSVYDLCTIACGTNDFKLNVPLGTKGVIGDTTFDDTTFYGAYRKAVEYILTNSPTIRLVLMTPLQRDNSGYDVNYTNSAGCKLIDYVDAIRNIGEMYGLPVCNMYENSGFTKKTLATYTLDGLHPNTTGYIRMGNYLTGFLNAIGN